MSLMQGVLAIVLWCVSPALIASDNVANLAEINRLYAEISQRLAVPDRDAAEVLRDHSGLLVDVRTDTERAVSMLPGAIGRVDFEALPIAEQQNAVIYCTIGVRSGEYVAELAKKGVSATNLAGGLLAWIHAGGEVMGNGEVVTEAHVYGRRWQLLPEPYKAKWFWWML